jgi:hypothetical protein
LILFRIPFGGLDWIEYMDLFCLDEWIYSSGCNVLASRTFRDKPKAKVRSSNVFFDPMQNSRISEGPNSVPTQMTSQCSLSCIKVAQLSKEVLPQKRRACHDGGQRLILAT